MSSSSMVSIFIFLITGTLTKDFYFYADIRWDNVEQFKSEPDSIPYDHGLRILPALHIALEKLQTLNLWSASPVVQEQVTKNFFYQSNSEFLASCKTVDGSEGSYNRPCFVHANYDIGFCSPSVLEPGDASAVTLHCKNNPKEDHIFSFKLNQTDESSVNMSIIPEGSNVHIVLPDGTGLPAPDLEKFSNEFDSENLTETMSLLQLSRRIEFVSTLVGKKLAGIVGSSENAFYTAHIAKRLGISNFVSSVTDRQG